MQSAAPHRRYARMFLALLLALPLHVFAGSFTSFRCDGVAVEAGQKRTLSATEEFRDGAPKGALAEASFNFRYSNSQRLNLQLRALDTSRDLQVAATYLELSTEPLGRVDAAFFENVFSSRTNGVFVIEKHFPGLEIHLACRPQR